MEKRRLGRTGMEITPIGFGAWAIGGGNWEFGWGPQDEQAGIEAVQRAMELGMNWIDTAAAYGLGRSEKLVGRAISDMDERPFVFTKCSITWDEQRRTHRNLSADSIRRECDASLDRLGIDAIDLYQIHWPIPEEDIEEGWTTLARLKEEGLVRHIGVSNFSVRQLNRIAPIAPVETLQPPYSLIHRDIEDDVLPFCAEHDIGVLVYSPMASGLLTGAMTRERVTDFPEDDWRGRSPDFQEPRLSRNLALAEKLREVGQRHGRAPGEVAIGWTLRHPAVTAAIVGGRSPEQVEGIIGACAFRPSEGEAREIEDFYDTFKGD